MPVGTRSQTSQLPPGAPTHPTASRDAGSSEQGTSGIVIATHHSEETVTQRSVGNGERSPSESTDPGAIDKAILASLVSEQAALNSKFDSLSQMFSQLMESLGRRDEPTQPQPTQDGLLYSADDDFRSATAEQFSPVQEDTCPPNHQASGNLRSSSQNANVFQASPAKTSSQPHGEHYPSARAADPVNPISLDNNPYGPSSRGPSPTWSQPDHYRRSRLNPVTVVPVNHVPTPTFGGNRAEARSWLKQYQESMRINGYDEEQMLIRASAYLKGEASEWFTARRHLDRFATWHSIKQAFLKHFCGVDGNDILRKKLADVCQKHEEHPSVYLARIMNLCLEYNPDMSDPEIVNRAARGLNSYTYNALVPFKSRELWTLDWLSETLEQFKPAHENQRDRTKGALPRNKSPPARPKNLSTWTCYNCGETGHTIPDCKSPRNEAKIKERLEAHREKKRTQNGEKSEKSTEPRQVGALNRTPPDSPRAQSPEVPTLACDVAAKPLLTVNVNGKDYTGRVDTGADITAIPGNVAKELNLVITPWDQPALQGVGNPNLQVVGMSTVLASYGNAKRAILVAVISPTHLNQILWGWDFVNEFKIKLDHAQPKPQPDIPRDDVVARPVNMVVHVDQPKPHPLDSVQFGKLGNEDKTELENVLVSFQDVFSRNDADIGRTNLIKHSIILTDDKPVANVPYRVPFRNRDMMEETINKMLAAGVIRESTSPYASPVFFVDKDHGQGKRLVVDYRALNAKTIPNRLAMPHPEDVFGMLGNTKVFAKLDITAMFNQIEVDECDIQKTAITTQFGLFEYPLMPFGLINAPATAVRLMQAVLRGLDGKSCFVYFDDIIVFAANVRELVQRCTEILTRLRKHGLKLKPTKCIFAVESVSFLGHIISSRGVEMDPRRVEDVKKFPTPRNPTDVRSFHGLCSYNRKFIKGFADIARPLTPLMGKPTDFQWNSEAQAAFENLRDALIRAPILVHFNPDGRLELRTDASGHAIGAVLYQQHPDPSQTGVILYLSKTLTSTQKRYSATERELLAAFYSIKELQHYLLGKNFTLVTDHAALSLLRNHKDPQHRLARWVAQLQQYDFDVVYKSGIKHLDADCMSRFVRDEPEKTDNDPSREDEIIRSICNVTFQDPDSQDVPPRGSPVNMRDEQRQDPYCRKYIDILESNTLSELEKYRRAPSYSIQDNLLYRGIGDSLTLVVPERRRSAILISFHDLPLAGHLGFTRTYRAIKSRYFWPKMRTDIKRYVSSCHSCQRRKALNQRKQGLIKPLPVAEDVFDTIGIDLMTKLPTSYAGFNTLLVCTDNLSKYVIAVPLRNETADTIIHALFNHVVAKFGCPRLVISDQGSNFCSESSRDFFRLFGIKRVTTSAYHPQSNGQTERFNRTIAIPLTMFVEQNQRDWSDFVQALTFAYNVSEHSVTRVTPHELVFGRRPRLPIDNLLNRQEFVDPTRPAPGVLSTHAVNKLKDLIMKNQQANKKRLDKRLSPPTFKEGDLVLVERPTRVEGSATKLNYVYIGPYKIVRKISDWSYEIGLMRGHVKPTVVHPCHLKRYVPRLNLIGDDIIDPTFIPREEAISPEPGEELSTDENQHIIQQANDADEIFNDPLCTPPIDVAYECEIAEDASSST